MTMAVELNRPRLCRSLLDGSCCRAASEDWSRAGPEFGVVTGKIFTRFNVALSPRLYPAPYECGMSKCFYEDLPAFTADLCEYFSPAAELCRRIWSAKDGGCNRNHAGAGFNYKWRCLQGDTGCCA